MAHDILDHSFFEDLIPNDYFCSGYEFDLSNIRFVKPHGAVALLLLLIFLGAQKKKIRIIAPSNAAVNEYLNRNGFFQHTKDFVTFVNLPYYHLLTNLRPTDTMHALTKIRNKSDIRPALDKFISYMSNDLGIKRRLVNEMWTVMEEMTSNITEHAYPKNKPFFISEGYVNVQYLPRIKKLYFTVGDLGVGIKNSLNNSSHNIFKFSNDNKAIESIMIHPLSSKEGLRGGGVYITTEKVKELGGWMLVRSGRGLIMMDPEGGFHTKVIKPFPGTQISIHIPYQ